MQQNLCLKNKYDMDEREKLILDNLNLVHFVLKKYIRAPDAMYEDLYQEGVIGLTNAVDRFDDSKSKFSTFAVHCILRKIQMYIRDNNVIHVPRDFFKNGNELQLLSLDEEVNDDGFSLMLTLDDETALDELNYQLLEDTVIVEMERILSDYPKTHRDVCIEDLCSKMWDEPVTQQYLSNKYGVSQSHTSRILRKFYNELRERIK